MADVAYPEHIGGGHLVEDPPVVTRLTTLFDELCSQALRSGTHEEADPGAVAEVVEVCGYCRW